MKKIDIIKSQQSHIDDLHSKIKQSDIDEVDASHGMTAKEALDMSLHNSHEAYTVTVDGKPEMMFGVVETDEDGVAIIWMLSSDEIFKMVTVKRFIRETKRWVKHFHKEFAVLFNHVDERNMRSLNWLRRVGFKLAERVESYGSKGLPFIQIISIRR